MNRYKSIEKDQTQDDILFKMMSNVMNRNPTLDKGKNDLDFLKEYKLSEKLKI